jgi:hypothetical protein
MARKHIDKILRTLCLSGALVVTWTSVARAGGGDCCEKCPPPYIHCIEGPPRLKFKCGCPRPVCGPCDLQHFGYFPTCWQAWPWPPDYSHCPVPPTGPFVQVPAVLPPLPGANRTPATPYSTNRPEAGSQAAPATPGMPMPRPLPNPLPK